MRALLFRMGGWVIGLAAIALVFGAINLVLVGGQWLWHHGDQAKLDLLKTELNSETTTISGVEAKLDGLKNEIREADEKGRKLKEWIDSVEQEFSAGIPEYLFATYKKAVKLFNESAAKHNESLSAYNAVYQGYSAQIDAHNRKVEQANTLAKSVGSTWYLVPVPGRRSGTHASHSSPAAHSP